MHDICWVQKPGNKFSPKTAFLDTLIMTEEHASSLLGHGVPPAHQLIGAAMLK